MLIKPMGIGQLIDRSFQLYRKHFVKLVLLMLILFGPIYLLQSLLLSSDQAADSRGWLQQLQEGSSYEEMITSLEGTTSSIDAWKIVLILLVGIPIIALIITPISSATPTLILLKGKSIYLTRC